MKGTTRFCVWLLAACVLLAATPPAWALMGMEEAIVYDNQVLETVQEQLEGLNLEPIRAKHGLILERTMQQIQGAIVAGDLTYKELTAFYLDRIARFDKAPGGLNAVVSVNPQALQQARQLDAAGKPATSPVYGMPVLVKDNINTQHLPTSAGTYALKDFVPAQDAQVVQRLLAAGAIVLGKSNLSELANFMGEDMPSGYSAALGQTRNPFDPGMLSPQGSSAGSGAAVAANLCAAALGTETTGSIVAPSNIHSIVGFKPSLHRISTRGVVPLASTMDTVGPMAKSVEDAVALYNAAAELGQQITLNRQLRLKGKRIGVLPGEDSDTLIAALKQLGAEPVSLSVDEGQVHWDTEFILLQDFAADFAAYATAHQAPVKTLAELVAFNQQDLPRRAKYGQGLLELAAQAGAPQREKVAAMVQAAQAFADNLFTAHGLDAIAFVNNDHCDIPCTAGYPEMTVPMGKNAFDEPIGATFFMRAHQDEALASLALAFEQGTLLRQLPQRYQANP